MRGSLVLGAVAGIAACASCGSVSDGVSNEWRAMVASPEYRDSFMLLRGTAEEKAVIAAGDQAVPMLLDLVSNGSRRDRFCAIALLDAMGRGALVDPGMYVYYCLEFYERSHPTFGILFLNHLRPWIAKLAAISGAAEMVRQVRDDLAKSINQFVWIRSCAELERITTEVVQWLEGSPPRLPERTGE